MDFGQFVATVFAVAFGIILAGIISAVIWFVFIIALVA